MQRLEGVSERLVEGLSRYGFSTAEIQELIGAKGTRSPSGRTIKKRRRMSGELLRAGRRKVSGKVKQADLASLAFLVFANPDFFSEDFLHQLLAVKTAFGLGPEQFRNWLQVYVHRGGVAPRPCLYCKKLFISRGPADRVGPCCKQKRQRHLKQSRGSLGDAERGF